MNRKLSHAIFLVGDIFFLGLLWLGHQGFNMALTNISKQAEIVEFNSRAGFFIVCIGLPLIHLLVYIENLFPPLSKKVHKIVNLGLVFFVAALLSAGFLASFWLQYRAENAGYIYCRNVSGVSALAKNLIYTKDMEICEALVAAKHERK